MVPAGFTAEGEYDGLDALTGKQNFAKVLFGAENSALLVGDNFKEFDKRLVKLVYNLPDTLNTLSVFFSKVRNSATQ